MTRTRTATKTSTTTAVALGTVGLAAIAAAALALNYRDLAKTTAVTVAPSTTTTVTCADAARRCILGKCHASTADADPYAKSAWTPFKACTTATVDADCGNTASKVLYRCVQGACVDNVTDASLPACVTTVTTPPTTVTAAPVAPATAPVPVQQAQVTASRPPSYCKGDTDPVNLPADLLFARPLSFANATSVALSIKNAGKTGTGSFEMRIVETLTNGTLREQTRILSAIGPNRTFDTTYGFGSGVRSIQFTLDSKDQVKETNECNNIASITVELI